MGDEGAGATARSCGSSALGPAGIGDNGGGAGRTTVSTARERDWKARSRGACARAAAPGRSGRRADLPHRRSVAVVANLWKMAIDALDPILGRSFPDDEWDPKDGRVVRLGIHVREDRSVGWDVPFVIRARPAALDWPEMTWFAAMGETERAEWLANHERRWRPHRRSRRGTTPQVGPPASLSHPEGGSAPERRRRRVDPRNHERRRPDIRAGVLR